MVVKGTRSLFRNQDDMITANVQGTVLSKAGSLDKLLNQIPFVSGSTGEYNVFGRGQAVVYLNNHKVYDANTLSTLNSDRVKKVQVITNPNARYGADVKAVIKIFTVDNPDGLGGNVYSNNMMGRRFMTIDGGSLTWNIGRVQLTGGLGYVDYKTRQYTEDRVSILSEPQMLYTNNTTLNYDMRNFNANLGLTFQPTKSQTLGFNTRLMSYRHKHSIDDERIAHYIGGEKDFSVEGSNVSELKPTTWISNLFYSIRAGKTSVDLTDDVLYGRKKRDMDYDEDAQTGVTTNSSSHYFMNSFVADLNTKLGKNFSLNYGGELTYSRHKQGFDFTESGIETAMERTENKNEQLLAAAFANLRATLGRFSVSAGLRYEYADWDYYLDNMRQKSQSRSYSDLFPTLNLSFNPAPRASISIGYRSTVRRPGYSELNDNVEYQSRYYYVQGNSLLDYVHTHSLNLLASWRDLRLIGSCDFVDGDIAMGRSVFGDDGSIVLNRAMNVDDYVRWSVGLNWRRRFGFYSPSVEVSTGGQSFSYAYLGRTEHFNDPYVNFKLHNTFSLRGNVNINFFVDYNGRNYSQFKKTTEQWGSQLSVSKNWRGFFVQLSLNNMLCPRGRTSTTLCDWINDSSYTDRDNRNVSLLLSYTFNYKQRRHNARTKSSEARRF